MKLPLVKGRQLFCPRRPLCPVCKKSKILEPHSFAVLTGGALIMDRRRRNGRMDDALDGFLDLVWHGSHDGGEGQERTCVFPSWTCQQWGMFPSRQRAYDYRSHRPGDVRSVPGSSAGVAEDALLEVGWDQDDGDQLIEGADGNAVR